MGVPNRFIFNIITRMATAGLLEEPFVPSSLVPNDGSSTHTQVYPHDVVDADEMTLVNEEGKLYRFGGRIDIDDGGLVAPPPFVSFTRKKKIVRTEVTSGGSIVEHVGMDDYDIRMRGILVDMDKHLYPEQAIRGIREIFEYKKTYKVSSRQFVDMGVETIYFEDVNVEGLVGYEDTYVYSLRACSMEPLNFKLIA